MCYIWLESYGCVDSHYQLLNNVPGTRLAPDFCQQFGTQIITPSETLSYEEDEFKFRNRVNKKDKEAEKMEDE